MANFVKRRVWAYRVLQLAVLLVSALLIALGVVLASPPYGSLTGATAFAVLGALLLALGLRWLDLRGRANRRKYRSHIAQVRGQVDLLAGRTGNRQGVVLSDWGNARWRDEGERGERSSYRRLPLLVPRADVTWPVFTEEKTNTGVPIDEISGMNSTLDHLRSGGAGRLSVGDIVSDSKRVLRGWSAFDELFEARLLGLAREKLTARPEGLEVGWEQTAWFPPAKTTWRLGADGLAMLTMTGSGQNDRPMLHPLGSGDVAWFVRLGSSSIWLLIGSPPLPDSQVEADMVAIITLLLPDQGLRATYRKAVEGANDLWSRVNVLRADLSNYPVDDATCGECEAIWFMAPATT